MGVREGSGEEGRDGAGDIIQHTAAILKKSAMRLIVVVKRKILQDDEANWRFAFCCCSLLTPVW